MSNLIIIVFSSFFFAMAVAYFSTPLVIKFAKRFDLIDDPKKNKHEKVIHKHPIPRAGGLAAFIAIATAVYLYLPLDQHVIGILGGITVLTVLGVLDDKYDINPYVRFAIQFFAAAIPIASGIGIAYLSNPIGGIINLSQPQISIHLLGQTRSIWVLSDIFALLWIVFLMNIVNMGAKGIAGQLSGVTVIASIVIGMLSFKFSADIAEWPVIILAAITAGAFLGFLPWNFPPQKIMPGFSGSTVAGYLLAILSILTTAKVGTLLVVLGVPIIDTGYTIVRRVSSGKSPFWGDRGHLHHRLLDNNLSKRQVVYFYWTVTAILGTAALNLNASNKLYTIVGVAVIIGGLLFVLTYKPKNEKIHK